MAVEGAIIVGKVSLEGVGGPLFFGGFGLVAPDEEGVVFIAASSAFPFRFGGQAFVGPFAVGFGVFFGDADDGVVHFVLDRAIGAGGMLPGGAGDKLPPLPFGAGLPFFNFASRCFEDEGSGFQLVLGSVGEILFGEASFGLGLVAGGLDEFSELGIGDFGGVDEEGGDRDFVYGLFLRVLGGAAKAAVFAAGVGATRDKDHARRGWRDGGGCLFLRLLS